MKIKVLNISLLCSSFLLSCSTHQPDLLAAAHSAKTNDLFIVNCLLPGQVRSLGKITSYITAKRSIKTSVNDCKIRGGEYVSNDQDNSIQLKYNIAS